MSSLDGKFEIVLAAVQCPICSAKVSRTTINEHIDSGCSSFTLSTLAPSAVKSRRNEVSASNSKKPLAPIFVSSPQSTPSSSAASNSPSTSKKREFTQETHPHTTSPSLPPAPKRLKTSAAFPPTAPLAERLRPQDLSEFVGHSHVTGQDSLLKNMFAPESPSGSIIFWGPPGCGKTSLARLLANQSDAAFKELSATNVGVNDVRQVVEEAKNLRRLLKRKTILFLDEVHRFNRAQQDIFLPYLEQNTIQLIGATTENPSFKINSALLSRCRVVVLERLSDEDIREIIFRAIRRVSLQESNDVLNLQVTLPSDCVSSQLNQSTNANSPILSSSQASSATCADGECSSQSTKNEFPSFPHVTSRIINSMISLASGDARTAISLTELVLSHSPSQKDDSSHNEQFLLDSLRRSVSTSYDRTGDSHYDMISALHKSVRGSDGSAAMYWLARMLTAGEDPLYVARRMVVCASEDIGLADPQALPLAIAALHACQVVGMPECRLNLAHIVAYLAEAPKSTRAYEAYKRAEEAAKRDMTLPVPHQIRNAPTKLMSDLGYGEGYRYNPDYLHPVTNDYLPSSLKDEIFLKEDGNTEGKIWDQLALMRWENEKNRGEEWEGRHKRPAEGGLSISP